VCVTARRREYSGCSYAGLAAASMGRAPAVAPMPPGILPWIAPQPLLVVGLQRRCVHTGCLTFDLGDPLVPFQKPAKPRDLGAAAANSGYVPFPCRPGSAGGGTVRLSSHTDDKPVLERPESTRSSSTLLVVPQHRLASWHRSRLAARAGVS
jgi:hypothetical protein